MNGAPRQLIGALHSDGFLLIRTRGSHHIYRRADGRRVVVAYHRVSHTFPVRTLRAVLDDAEWTESDLVRLRFHPLAPVNLYRDQSRAVLFLLITALFFKNWIRTVST